MRRLLFLYTEKAIGEYQNGLGKEGRQWMQLMFLTRPEKCYELDTELQIVLIDFKKTFDSVDRRMLQEDVRQHNLSEKLVRLIKTTQNRTTVAVKTQERIAKRTVRKLCEKSVQRGVQKFNER